MATSKENGLTGSTEMGREEVFERARNPHILAQLLATVALRSSSVQMAYLSRVADACQKVRALLERLDLIQAVARDRTRFWIDVRGEAASFVDGGVFHLEGFGAEPLGIRACSYTVIPGAEHSARERFTPEQTFVAELFDEGDTAAFEGANDPSETTKLREIARWCLELSAALKCARREPVPRYVCLHGALVNPAAPYSAAEFPRLSPAGLEQILGAHSDFRKSEAVPVVEVYAHLLLEVQKAGCHVVSVVERPSPSSILWESILESERSKERLSGRAIAEHLKELGRLKLSDSILFHLILKDGEFVLPQPINRNPDEKSPSNAQHVIRTIPKPAVSYLGFRWPVRPLRVEQFESDADAYDEGVRFVYHSSNLLPDYCFPAGLHIVDQFAKLPNALTGPIRRYAAVQLVRNVVGSGNAAAFNAAKHLLAGPRREWYSRPVSE